MEFSASPVPAASAGSIAPVGTITAPPAPEGAGEGPRAVVIGAGFGGLAAAMRLQGRGFRVTLLEAREKVGGRAYRLRKKGYTFDMGPSLITAPEVLDRAFRAVGTSLAGRLDLRPLDPYYRVCFHDGSVFEYSGDPEVMKARMRVFHPGDADNFDAFMDAIRPIYEEVLEKGLGSTPFCDWRTMVRFLPKVFRLGAWRTVTGFVNRYFKDFRHRFLFSFHPLYIGGHPFRSPAVYLMIPYLERKGGVWYAPGGMYSVIEAMAAAFVDAGGEILTGRPASGLRVSGGRAVGVETAGGFLPAELVVSNADLVHTYRDLVPAPARRRWTERRLGRLKQTMGCFLIFVGSRRAYPALAHHTLVLAERYKGLVDDIFGAKALPEDFSLYLHAPCRTDPGMAPPGGESLMILAPVANLSSGMDWEQGKAAFADRILAFLEAWGLPGLRAEAEVLDIVTPADFARDLNAHQGNAFGIQPLLTQTGWFRPHNRSEDIPNLYFVGAGTHPGAGVPGVLLSAEAAETCILEDFPSMARRVPGPRP
jgi:phytoene desaturase